MRRPRRDSREQPRAPLTTERRACGFITVSRSTFPPLAAPPRHVRVSSPLPRPSTLGLAPSWSSLRRPAALSLTRSSPCWSSTRPTHRRRTVCPAADGTPVGETRPVWLASAVRAAAALAEAGRSSGQPEHDLALTDRLCSTCPHAGGRPLGFFFAAASGSSTLALLAEDFSPVSLSPLGGCLDHPPFAVPCQYIPLAPTKQPASASKLTAPDSLVAFGGRPRPAVNTIVLNHSSCHEGAHDVCAGGAKRVTQARVKYSLRL